MEDHVLLNVIRIWLDVGPKHTTPAQQVSILTWGCCMPANAGFVQDYFVDVSAAAERDGDLALQPNAEQASLSVSSL